MSESQAFREVWSPRLLSLVRILLGLIYLQHGLQKYFGSPTPQPPNSNRYNSGLNIPSNHTKQTPAPNSNRHK